jgi:hypothetical protein
LQGDQAQEFLAGALNHRETHKAFFSHAVHHGAKRLICRSGDGIGSHQVGKNDWGGGWPGLGEELRKAFGVVAERCCDLAAAN